MIGVDWHCLSAPFVFVAYIGCGDRSRPGSCLAALSVYRIIASIVTFAGLGFPLPTSAFVPASATTAHATGSSQALAGREQDARVALIAYQLATAARARCPSLVPITGLVFQHLSQFELVDRPGMIVAHHLDRGPGIAVVVPGSPAADAGLRAGDVMLTIDGAPIPAEASNNAFDAKTARAWSDLVSEMLARRDAHPVKLSILRGDTILPVTLTTRPGCPSRVHLARSGQRNAYADGRHVFLTTGLLTRIDNDAELAFVIAHEMAHNILEHATVMRSGSVRKGLGRTLGRSGRIVRGSEQAADALAGMMMIDASYDPVAGATILRRLGRGPGLFAAHARAGDRIESMRALVEANRTP